MLRSANSDVLQHLSVFCATPAPHAQESPSSGRPQSISGQRHDRHQKRPDQTVYSKPGKNRTENGMEGRPWFQICAV